jgi:hypothetical protein
MYGSKNWAQNIAERRLTERGETKLLRRVSGHDFYDYEYANMICTQLGIFKEEYTNKITNGMNTFAYGTPQKRRNKYASI